MLAQAVTGTPGHVNSMAESVRHFIQAFPTQSMAEGDVYCTNNPWKGTGHLNDLVVTTPAFHRGRLIGLFSCTSHIVDLGGIGFGPDGTDVFMEGICLPFLKLVNRAGVNDTLMQIVKANTRLPVETEGDIYSLINCNEIGCRRLSEMMAEFGLSTLDDLSADILESSRAEVLAEIARLPRGSWRYEMTIDGYDTPITLAATTTIAEDEVRVDFAGTSAASRFGINCPLAYATAYSVFGLSCALAPRLPNNAGSLSAHSVTVPAHTIVNALPPAPVASRHIVGQMLPDVVFGGLRQAIPDRVPAEGTSCLYLMTFRTRDAEAKRRFAMAITSNASRAGDKLCRPRYPSASVHPSRSQTRPLSSPRVIPAAPAPSAAAMGWSWRSRTDRTAQSKSSLPSTAPNSRRAGGRRALWQARLSRPQGCGQAARRQGSAGNPRGRAPPPLYARWRRPRRSTPPRCRPIAADLKNGLISLNSARANYGVEQESSDVGDD